MVNKTIKNLNIQHQWIKINKKDSLDNLIKILKQRLTPISTVTYYIQWLMFKKISEGNARRRLVERIQAGRGSLGICRRSHGRVHPVPSAAAHSKAGLP